MEEDVTIKTDDKFTKPAFDGRMGYVDILKAHMMAISRAAVDVDYNLWVNSLQSYYSTTFPFIRDAEKKEIDIIINKIEQLGPYAGDSNDSLVEKLLHKKLNELMKKLYSSTKHLLMPSKADEDEELDFDNFMKGSN